MAGEREEMTKRHRVTFKKRNGTNTFLKMERIKGMNLREVKKTGYFVGGALTYMAVIWTSKIIMDSKATSFFTTFLNGVFVIIFVAVIYRLFRERFSAEKGSLEGKP